jgi:hypothetical protein
MLRFACAALSSRRPHLSTVRLLKIALTVAALFSTGDCDSAFCCFASAEKEDYVTFLIFCQAASLTHPVPKAPNRSRSRPAETLLRRRITKRSRAAFAARSGAAPATFAHWAFRGFHEARSRPKETDALRELEVLSLPGTRARRPLRCQEDRTAGGGPFGSLACDSALCRFAQLRGEIMLNQRPSVKRRPDVSNSSTPASPDLAVLRKIHGSVARGATLQGSNRRRKRRCTAIADHVRHRSPEALRRPSPEALRGPSSEALHHRSSEALRQRCLNDGFLFPTKAAMPSF